jgi:hypothetical protein
VAAADGRAHRFRDLQLIELRHSGILAQNGRPTGVP